MQTHLILFSVLTSILTVSLLSSFIIYILFQYKKKQKNFAKQVAEINQSFERELLKTQLEIQEQTFQHISQELHDNVGQLLTLAKLSLNDLCTSDNLSIRKIGESTFKVLTNCLDEVRNLSKNLNTYNIENAGLVKAVEIQLEQLEKTGHFGISLEVTGKSCFMNEHKEIVLFRIIQESINNIIRHSKADKIEIKFHYGDKSLHLIIKDNGTGFSVKDKIQDGPIQGSSGLNNIIRRAAMINAHHSIESTEGKGTCINITTPI